jgi:hypothetical protein
MTHLFEGIRYETQGCTNRVFVTRNRVTNLMPGPESQTQQRWRKESVWFPKRVAGFSDISNIWGTYGYAKIRLAERVALFASFVAPYVFSPDVGGTLGHGRRTIESAGDSGLWRRRDRRR